MNPVDADVNEQGVTPLLTCALAKCVIKRGSSGLPVSVLQALLIWKADRGSLYSHSFCILSGEETSSCVSTWLDSGGGLPGAVVFSPWVKKQSASKEAGVAVDTHWMYLVQFQNTLTLVKAEAGCFIKAYLYVYQCRLE